MTENPTDPTAPQVVRGVVRGVELEIASDVLDDFELMLVLGRTQSENDPTLGAAALYRVLGAEQTQRLMDAVRDKETGRVSGATGVELIREVFALLNPNS